VDGRKGAQALSLRILEAPPSLSAASRKPAEDLAIITEDLIRLLDQIGSSLKRGKYPETSHARKVAQLLRRVADELEG
jgi:CspA family cold shock protein